MTESSLIVPPAERPTPLNIAGFAITVLASTAQTGGYEIFFQTGPEGTGPGPHRHPWDESFYALRGEVTCGTDNIETVAGPGTLVHVPSGATHWYKFGKRGGELLSMTSQGNASRMYEDFDREGSWENADPEHIATLAAKHGQIVAPAQSENS